MIDMQCPRCQRALKFSPEQVGSPTTCAFCRRQFVVPSPGGDAEPLAADEVDQLAALLLKATGVELQRPKRATASALATELLVVSQKANFKFNPGR